MVTPLWIVLGYVAVAQTPIDVQAVKELVPNGTLGTCFYAPLSTEAPFFGRLSDKEKVNDPVFHGDYSIHGKKGKYVAWFGIVRGISPTTPLCLFSTISLMAKRIVTSCLSVKAATETFAQR